MYAIRSYYAAGGHLGAKPENIGNGSYDQYATVRGVKDYFREEWNLDIPIIAAGGIWDRNDILHALEQGAGGVQMASRFVCTEECDASEAFKQAYLKCTQDDIGLIMSRITSYNVCYTKLLRRCRPAYTSDRPA